MPILNREPTHRRVVGKMYIFYYFLCFENASKIDPKLSHFGTHFGSILDPKMYPKIVFFDGTSLDGLQGSKMEPPGRPKDPPGGPKDPP